MVAVQWFNRALLNAQLIYLLRVQSLHSLCLPAIRMKFVIRVVQSGFVYTPVKSKPPRSTFPKDGRLLRGCKLHHTITSRLLSSSRDSQAIGNERFNKEKVLSRFAFAVSQHRFSVAPMMEYTDRHQRQLQRLITKQAVLYTEMVTSNALVRSPDTERFLGAELPTEDPLVLQLGGSDPQQMRIAAQKAVDFGYKEINLNVGCPSDKVADAGCFGAALMLKPHLVSALCLSIAEATGAPATVKCRIGVDDEDSYESLCNFIRTVHEAAGVRHFIIHARKAVLGGKFSPADNRKIPPLKYHYVYDLVRDFPALQFSINGGIVTMEESLEQLRRGVAGVMVGRAAVNTPFIWRTVDSEIYGVQDPGLSRREIVEKYAEYAAKAEEKEGERVRRALIKPMHNLFHAEPNGKVFRRLLDEGLLVITRGQGAPPSAVRTAVKPNVVQQQHQRQQQDEVVDMEKEEAEELEEKKRKIQEQQREQRASLRTAADVLHYAIQCLPNRVLDMR